VGAFEGHAVPGKKKKIWTTYKKTLEMHVCA